MKATISNLIVGAVIGVCLSLLFFKEEDPEIIYPEPVYIEKVVVDTLPGRVDTFEVDKPVYLSKTVPDSNLIQGYKDLESENAKLIAYIESITHRTYSQDHVSDDGKVSVTVRDSVQGFLLNQNIRFTILSDTISRTETIGIIQPIQKIKKKSILSVGAGLNISPEYLGDSSLEALGALKNKKGTTYLVGYSANRNIRFGALKDIKF